MTVNVPKDSIVVIDNDQATRLLLETLGGRADFNVAKLDSGDAALEFLDEFREITEEGRQGIRAVLCNIQAARKGSGDTAQGRKENGTEILRKYMNTFPEAQGFLTTAIGTLQKEELETIHETIGDAEIIPLPIPDLQKFVERLRNLHRKSA